MTRRLVTEVFQQAFDNPLLHQHHDGAVFNAGGARLAFTTDSYVVQPLFFPGGDIGKMAVCGTVNDLAMCGARPVCLSVGLIIEEGFPMADLRRVVESMREAAAVAGVDIATGDTKVVDRGKGDGLFINTSGVGIVEDEVSIGPRQVQPGDAVLLTGDIGRHGIAILTAREGLELEQAINSDCAPLVAAVGALRQCGAELHCLRDLTRGGLATALKEIALDSGHEIRLQESAIPVGDGVRGAAELLGLDPLYVANEGRMIVILPAAGLPAALAALKNVPATAGAVQIGSVTAATNSRLILETAIGANRVLDLLTGEQLPRIC